MLTWYQENLVDTGRSPAVWALLGFLVAFAVTRWVTLRIRARSARGEQPDGPIRDIHIGGVHVHHQVWGILLVLLTGLLEIRYRPEAPWAEVLAALFGVGAALALDEFALWLHLDDVYWSAEGRKSIDAVMVAIGVAAILVLASSPVGLDEDAVETGGWGVATLGLAIHMVFVLVTLLKGKLVTGLLGIPVTLVAWVGAFRLAKPDSFWARRFYRDGPKARRSLERFPPGGPRPLDRVRDRLAGTGP